MAELSKVMELVASSGVVEDMSKFDPNKTFKENGVDSLDVMSIFLAVEEGLGFKFTDEEAGKINSVATMLDIINKSASRITSS